MSLSDQQLLNAVRTLAEKASQAVLAVYRGCDGFDVQTKLDNTPLTEADLASHQIICEGLDALQPQYPVLSEESEAISFEERQQWQRYWLVDPLDGTKEFIERTDEFSILIALIDNHQPILGVVYAPVLEECYFALRGEGAFHQTADGKVHKLSVSSINKQKLRIIASRRHGVNKFAPFLEGFDGHEIVNRGSALKLAAIATAEADIYPRFGFTSEWDTAAGQCILEEAGGKVMNLEGEVLQYNTKESLRNPEFIAVGDVSYDWLTAIKALAIKQ